MGKYLPIIILIVVVLVIGLVIIQKSPYKNEVPVANPKVEAVYSGTVPCADCPGIDETITFYSDKTYTDKNVYQERGVANINKGIWSIDKENIYQLTDSESSHKAYYQLQGDKLVPLDPDSKKPMEAPLNLSLTRNP